jgi:hemerythrin-like domain-containing protein
MAVLIGTAEPGFDDPVGLLTSCHRRIERFLAALSRITNVRAGGTLDAADRNTLEVALRYFREAAPHHTADEEKDLFPELRAAEPGAADALERLLADHGRADQLHALVDRVGLEWLRDGTLDRRQTDSMRAALEELTALYRDHIRLEEEEVFPKAVKCLHEDTLSHIGQEMAKRRGVAFAPGSGAA